MAGLKELLGLLWVLCAGEGWEGNCFANMAHMAHCCDQPERCFGAGNAIADKSHQECCGREFQEFLVNSLSQVVGSTDLEQLKEAHWVLKTYLIFVNNRDLDAWELLAQSAGKLAIAEYNALAEPTVLRSLDSEGLARKKHAVMRELNWAAQIGENYFQAAWYNLAEDTGKSAVETDINLVRPKFQSALQVYQVVQMAASQLVYDQDARYASVPQAPATQQEGPEVVLVVNVVGEWASVGVVTFWSILKHRSTPLRVFIFGDQPGIRDWRRVMREMQLAVPHLMHRLRFSYVDIFHHPRMASYFARLPPQCASTNMSKALFARLLCHELLPKEVDRAIAIDLGDILVFEDILGLWQEGDKLLPEEVLAAASHRSVEETLRHTKPTNLNGGVVLYEVSRMRSSGYTEDTLRAAQIGLAKGYDRFCVWDQDIINALQQDVWGNRGVRVLPCRWSLFPITGWQFFWNTPGYWLEELVQLRRYPGFLAVDHFEHFCPDAILMLHTVFAFASRRDRKLARDVALAQGLRNEQPGSAILSPEGSPCPCREKAALLHVPSTMKLWPWVQELFRHHSPPFLAPADSAALFRSRTEQGEEVGGGFWGSEGREDLESMQQGTLRWAMTAGASVVAGSCATLPTASGHYVRAELPALSDSSQLTVTAETNATEDAHLFIGKITTVPDHIHAMGLELVVDAFQSSRTVLRWGMRGEELASHQGRVLQEGAWSKFWMQVSSSGRLTVGSGGDVKSNASIVIDVMLDLAGGFDLVQHGIVYAGSLGETPAHWMLCQA